MLLKNYQVNALLRISRTSYNRFCDRSELSSQYRTQATRRCVYGLLSYAASSMAVAGHSSYGHLSVRANVRASDCPFPRFLTDKNKNNESMESTKCNSTVSATLVIKGLHQ